MNLDGFIGLIVLYRLVTVSRRQLSTSRRQGSPLTFAESAYLGPIAGLIFKCWGRIIDHQLTAARIQLLPFHVLSARVRLVTIVGTDMATKQLVLLTGVSFHSDPAFTSMPRTLYWY